MSVTHQITYDFWYTISIWFFYFFKILIIWVVRGVKSLLSHFNSFLINSCFSSSPVNIKQKLWGVPTFFTCLWFLFWFMALCEIRVFQVFFSIWDKSKLTKYSQAKEINDKKKSFVQYELNWQRWKRCNKKQ